MKLAQILAPVAAAAIVNCALLGLAWRATQIERRTGRAPWYLGAGIVVYSGAVLAFAYAQGKQPITTGLELFAASCGAQVLGAAVVFLASRAWTRTEPVPIQQRAFEIIAPVFLLVVIFSALFNG